MSLTMSYAIGYKLRGKIMRYQSKQQKAMNDWCTRLRRENNRLQKENKELKEELLKLKKSA